MHMGTEDDEIRDKIEIICDSEIFKKMLWHHTLLFS